MVESVCYTEQTDFQESLSQSDVDVDSLLDCNTHGSYVSQPCVMLIVVLCGYLYFGISNDIEAFQNRMGLFFFILALFGFSTLTSLNIFASERILFVRERANGYYSPITYFASKVSTPQEPI